MRFAGPALFLWWLMLVTLWLGGPMLLSILDFDLKYFVYWPLCIALSIWIISKCYRSGYRGVLLPPTGCAKCHYDLRGIDSDKCPECGTEQEHG